MGGPTGPGCRRTLPGPLLLTGALELSRVGVAVGWLLSLTAGVSLLDGYLATTPGGLYAVLPIAYGSGADTTFVLAVQGLRLFAMVLAAPAIVRWLAGGGRPPGRRAAARVARRSG